MSVGSDAVQRFYPKRRGWGSAERPFGSLRSLRAESGRDSRGAADPTCFLLTNE